MGGVNGRPSRPHSKILRGEKGKGKEKEKDKERQEKEEEEEEYASPFEALPTELLEKELLPLLDPPAIFSLGLTSSFLRSFLLSMYPHKLIVLDSWGFVEDCARRDYQGLLRFAEDHGATHEPLVLLAALEGMEERKIPIPPPSTSTSTSSPPSSTILSYLYPRIQWRNFSRSTLVRCMEIAASRGDEALLDSLFATLDSIVVASLQKSKSKTLLKDSSKNSKYDPLEKEFGSNELGATELSLVTVKAAKRGHYDLAIRLSLKSKYFQKLILSNLVESFAHYVEDPTVAIRFYEKQIEDSAGDPMACQLHLARLFVGALQGKNFAVVDYALKLGVDAIEGFRRHPDGLYSINHLEVLDFLKEMDLKRAATDRFFYLKRDRLAKKAMAESNLSVLKWLMDDGYKFTEEDMAILFCRHRFDMNGRFLMRGMVEPHKRLECIRFLFSEGYRWTQEMLLYLPCWAPPSFSFTSQSSLSPSTISSPSTGSVAFLTSTTPFLWVIMRAETKVKDEEFWSDMLLKALRSNFFLGVETVKFIVERGARISSDILFRASFSLLNIDIMTYFGKVFGWPKIIELFSVCR